jgi:hypothetical protein
MEWSLNCLCQLQLPQQYCTRKSSMVFLRHTVFFRYTFSYSVSYPKGILLSFFLIFYHRFSLNGQLVPEEKLGMSFIRGSDVWGSAYTDQLVSSFLLSVLDQYGVDSICIILYWHEIMLKRSHINAFISLLAIPPTTHLPRYWFSHKKDHDTTTRRCLKWSCLEWGAISAGMGCHFSRINCLQGKLRNKFWFPMWCWARLPVRGYISLTEYHPFGEMNYSYGWRPCSAIAYRYIIKNWLIQSYRNIILQIGFANAHRVG